MTIDFEGASGGLTTQQEAPNRIISKAREDESLTALCKEVSLFSSKSSSGTSSNVSRIPATFV